MSNDVAIFFYPALVIVCLVFLITRKLSKGEKKCPKCGAGLPVTRIPANLRELFWGGWTCQSCDTQVTVNFFGNITNRRNGN